MWGMWEFMLLGVMLMQTPWCSKAGGEGVKLWPVTDVQDKVASSLKYKVIGPMRNSAECDWIPVDLGFKDCSVVPHIYSKLTHTKNANRQYSGSRNDGRTTHWVYICCFPGRGGRLELLQHTRWFQTPQLFSLV